MIEKIKEEFSLVFDEYDGEFSLDEVIEKLKATQLYLIDKGCEKNSIKFHIEKEDTGYYEEHFVAKLYAVGELSDKK